MSFHNIRLPVFIEIFAVGSPQFATSCVSTYSGWEIRRSDRLQARQRYYIKNCRLSLDEFEQFNAFFRAKAGKNNSFRFRDHADYKVEGQMIDLKNDKKEFNLYKIYADKILPYKREITKPVPKEVKVYINNILIDTVKIDYSSGKVILSQILNAQDVVSFDCVYDIEVRFDCDNFKYHHHIDGSIELETLELVEVD